MRTRILAVAVGMVLAQAVSAAPITLSATLTGDPRAGNPDNLIVNVAVVGATTSNTVNWTVDINSPSHSNAKLDVFAFNMLGGFSHYTFSNFSPSGWSITNGNNVPGSGGADFLFESNDPPGNQNNVTNLVNLTFTMTKASGNFTEADFLDAPFDYLAGNPDWAGQMGAHLQSLSTADCKDCSSSGFAIGSWDKPDDPGEVPEPASLALLGIGLTGLALRKRK